MRNSVAPTLKKELDLVSPTKPTAAEDVQSLSMNLLERVETEVNHLVAAISGKYHNSLKHIDQLQKINLMLEYKCEEQEKQMDQLDDEEEILEEELGRL